MVLTPTVVSIGQAFRDTEQMSAQHILNVSIGYFFPPLFTVGGVSQMCDFLDGYNSHIFFFWNHNSFLIAV